MKRKIITFIISIFYTLMLFAVTVSAESVTADEMTSSYSGYSYHSPPSTSNGDSGSNVWGAVLGVAGVILAVSVYFLINYLNERSEYYNPPKESQTDISKQNAQRIKYESPMNHNLMIETFLKQHDHNFVCTKFIMQSENIFIDVKHAIQNYNTDVLELVEGDELLKKHTEQVKSNSSAKICEISDNISFMDSYLYKYEYSETEEYLTALHKVNLINYLQDKETGNSVHGSKRNTCLKFYFAKYVRPFGTISPIQEETKALNCPYCGGSVDYAVIGKCGYCGGIIKSSEMQWTLVDLEEYTGYSEIDNRGIIKLD